MQKLGPGESLTSGGYVRTAEGKVIVPDETLEFIQQVIAFGDFAGKTMPEVAAALGNCDPAPARDLKQGYEHTWSRPGYELRLQFGFDQKVTKLESQVGGPSSRGLKARMAEAVETANLIADGARRNLRRWLVSPTGVTIGDDCSVSVASGNEHLALLTDKGAWLPGSFVAGDFSDDGPQWDHLDEVITSSYPALASRLAADRARRWADLFLADEAARDKVFQAVSDDPCTSPLSMTPSLWGFEPEVDASTFEFVRFSGSRLCLVDVEVLDDTVIELSVQIEGTAFFSAFYEVPPSDDEPDPNATEFGTRKLVSRPATASVTVDCDVVDYEDEAEVPLHVPLRSVAVESLQWIGAPSPSRQASTAPRGA